MGHHINAQGQFQSDRHPDLEPDKVAVSFKCSIGRTVLVFMAACYSDTDPEFAADIRARIVTIEADES